MDKDGDGQFDERLTRRLVNVADGQDDSDAATVGQLNAVAAAAGPNPYLVVNSTGPLPTAGGIDAIALGEGANASGDYSVAIGLSSSAEAAGTVAIGDDAETTARFATAIGGSASASGEGATAFGTNAIASSGDTIAVGRDARATDADSVAIGARAQVDAENAVAIGSRSRNSEDFSVSFGDADTGLTRRLTNVTDARLDANSSDAVTGAQLFETNNNVSANASGIGQNALAISENTTNIETNEQNIASNRTDIDINTADIASLRGGLDGTQLYLAGDNSAGYSAASVVGANSVALGAGSVAVRDNALSVGDAATGLTRQITNVAPGAVHAASTDAVNGGQLFETNEAVTSNAAAIATNVSDIIDLDTAVTANTGDIANNSAAIAVNADEIDENEQDIADNRADIDTNIADIASLRDGLGGTQLYLAGDNSAGRAAAMVTGMDSVAIGAGSVAARDNVVSVGSAADGINRQITNVAAGTQANDAVNLGQLQTVTAVNAAAAATAQARADAAFDEAVTAQQEADLARASARAAMTAAMAATDDAAEAYGHADAAFEKAVEAQADADAALQAAAQAQMDADYALSKAQANAEELAYFAVNSTETGATATGENAVAIGPGALAEGDSSVAMGHNAVARNGQAVSIGAGNIADGNGAVAIGDPNIATGTGAVALGANNTASGTGAVALGNASTAIGNGAVALGNGAVAEGDGAVAIGAGAIAEAPNQITLGTDQSRYRTPGIGSSASLAAQQGALSLVTTDAWGNLGTSTLDISVLETLPSSVAVLNQRTDALELRTSELEQAVAYNHRQSNGGIAAAMAMSGTMIVPDSTWSMSFNLSSFNGEQGFSTSVVGRLTDNIYLSGSVAGSTVKSTTGGRIGLAIGF